MARMDSDDGISRITSLNPDTGRLDPKNILIFGGVGSGKSMTAEELCYYHYTKNYTVISISDVKDEIEQGYVMFPVEEPYHLRKLKKFGLPTCVNQTPEQIREKKTKENHIPLIPTKIYHPFTYNLPTDQEPNINIYTINIKNLTRADLEFLAESKSNKRSIQIILDTLAQLTNKQGLYHLLFKAEEQTENTANITKTGVKYRSTNPRDFFTKSKIGTEKTSGEMSAYFKPFIDDYILTPANTETNIDFKKIVNDQKHYHIFTTKWIKDKRLKAFCVLHLIQEILAQKDEAKHPILIYLEEIRVLTPNNKEGFTQFFASELKETMTKMRSMGKGGGYALIATTQSYADTHPDVIASFNETILGAINSITEINSVSKSLKYTTADTRQLQSLDTGEFIIKIKEDYSEDSTLQRIKPFMPPHMHKEQGYSFKEKYEKYFPEQMTTFEPIIEKIKKIDQEIIEEVQQLAQKENQYKKLAIQKQNEEKQKPQINKQQEEQKNTENKQKEKIEQLNDQITEIIYQEYQQATGKDKSYSNIAKKHKILLKNGEPNKMAVKRAIDKIILKKIQQEQNQEPEPDEETDPQDTYPEETETPNTQEEEQEEEEEEEAQR